MARIDTSSLAGIEAASTVPPQAPAAPAAPASTPGSVTDSKLNFNQPISKQDQELINSNNALAQSNTALAAATAASTTAANAAQQTQETNWIQAGKALLTQYDVGSLGDRYTALITTGGMDQNTALLELQSTNEWKQRFSGNEARLKAGLPVLSPADYLATEASYKDIMLRSGLPVSAVNDPAYLGKLIAADVSPVEVQQRVDAARIAVNNEDPFVTQQLKQQFNLTTGDLAMHLLDPSVASNIIAQKVTAAQIGAEASKQNTDISVTNAQALAAQGVTQAQAQQGFMAIGQQLPGTQALASRYAYNAPDQGVGAALQAATFGTAGGAEAEQRLKRLQTQEAAAFGGSAGASTQGQSLGVGNAQGVS